MLAGAIKSQRWSKLLGVLLVLTLVAGVVGFAGANSVYAATTSVDIYLDGQLQGTVDDSDISGLASYGNRTYSAVNSFGTKKFYSTAGASLADILAAGGVTSQELADVDSIEVTTEDNVTASFSKALLLGTDLYYYPNLTSNPPSTDGAVLVPTIIATAAKQAKEDYTGLSTADCLRLFRGQSALDDVNNPDFAKWITQINLITQ